MYKAYVYEVEVFFENKPTESGPATERRGTGCERGDGNDDARTADRRIGTDFEAGRPPARDPGPPGGGVGPERTVPESVQPVRAQRAPRAGLRARPVRVAGGSSVRLGHRRVRRPVPDAGAGSGPLVRSRPADRRRGHHLSLIHISEPTR